MDTSKELLKVNIRMSSYFAKVDALIEALDEHQRGAFKEALRRGKETYIRHHEEELDEELDEELLQLVDRAFQ